jgi:hypothetical protein
MPGKWCLAIRDKSLMIGQEVGNEGSSQKANSQ